VSVLLPEGVDDLKDAPHHLFDAVRFALVVLSFDELPSDERPPRRIWRDPDALEQHFAKVKKMREAKWGGDGKEPIEDPVENPLIEAIIKE
jgi:hypothetical protein